MRNFENVKVDTTVEDSSIESAKSILATTDMILKELAKQLNDIENAIFGPGPVDELQEEEHDICLLETLVRQKNAAEAILHTVMLIRKGLW